jgi:DNA-binding transcriptional MerR regulator
MEPLKNNVEAVGEEPLYNIGVVARVVGIPVTTIRAWERRYGFPDSARTAGGHRLYSERDLRRLHWVKAQIDQGMRTGQAIQALQHLEREGRSLEASLLSPTTGRRKGVDSSLVVFQKRLTAALLAHDTEQADLVLGEVLAIYPPEDLVLEVIGPTLNAIGEAWQEGHSSVATEHLASHFLRHHLISWMLSGPPTHPVRPTILACAPGEWHDGSLLMLGVLLRRLRWPVAYLGQSVPLPDLGSFVRQIRPPVVVLVAMTEEPARALMDLSRWVPEVSQAKRPVVGFGGRVFTLEAEWRNRVPGMFLGETVQEGLETLERLLRDMAPRLP